ncbi:MAG: oxygenase MpaB family protein [Chloroflexi bacterium]|nr:oxygenase MpaB family protein [Chloroflexota bacterium]
MTPPSSYAAGYAQARAINPRLADLYVEHTMIGDPLADAAVAALDDLGPEVAQRLINAGMERDETALREAPYALREFFEALERPPPFTFDPAKALPGSRAFYRHSDLFFVGLVLHSLITGLTEELSKAFYITGRTAGNLRRVKQNTRHLVEVTLPGGLDRDGDGWKITVRIRLIHAQLRRLLTDSDEWDVSTEGVPLHMSHMALASTGFSAFNLESARMLGVRLTDEEAAGFMHIWRYVTWLLGVPEALLWETEEDAHRIRAVAHAFESPPGDMGIAIAHGYIDTVPDLLGVTDPGKERKLLGLLMRTSRALIGNDLADRLDFPKQSTFGALALVRMQRRFQILRSRLVPGAPTHDFNNFSGMMQRSVYDDAGISYRLPDAVKDTESTPW